MCVYHLFIIIAEMYKCKFGGGGGGGGGLGLVGMGYFAVNSFLE